LLIIGKFRGGIPLLLLVCCCTALMSTAAARNRAANAAFLFQQRDTTAQDTTKKQRLDQLPLYYQDRYGDPFSNYVLPSPLILDNPAQIGISLDTSRQYFNVTERLGSLPFRPDTRIPFDEYKNYRYRQMTRNYWQDISLSQDGEEDLPGSGLGLPPIKLGRFAQRLFGGDEVTIQPNGSVILDFGGLFQRVDNPSLPIRQQRNGGFNFDQQIRMALQGNIGEKLSVNANFDTKNTFQFEQQYNIGYTAFEEDIVQEVNLGNVSFPVQNSLINGAQNLFGVTTRLRFGKLWLNTVFSNQRGSTQTLVIKNGAQSRDFELRADQYDMNRHFFLAQFFRENYERSLSSLPVITSGVVVTRVELYVTNRNNNTQTLRNVAAFMDLGEGRPFNNALSSSTLPDNAAANQANDLFAAIRNNPAARVADNVSNQIESQLGFNKGADFELLRGARRLEEREYVLNPQLGYVSLVAPLRNDEILAVAFEYTYNGQVYRVGELMEDYQNFGDEDVIFLKLLSPSTIRTDLPMWDLMMKNIYPLQTAQLSRENFQARVIYRDDLTGIDNPSLHEGQRTKDVPLVQLMNVDQLNQNNDPQPDGNWDFIEGLTVDTQNGRLIFPVLEPFGSTLRSRFNTPEELQLVNKYVFDTLYNGTQADAALTTTLNKFFIKGSYQSGSSNEIRLPGINIAENSVTVRAGNTMLTEGTDFTVDYNFGTVRIINQGVLNSGKEIRIQYEQADLFQFQQKSLVGLDAEYRLTKDIKFTGTLMHLNERPLIQRVSVGSEPTRNTVFGFGAEYSSESLLLTKIVDKIPFLSTKEQSSVSLKAEFAQILPGSPRLLGPEGTAYIDDFEQAEVPYDLANRPAENWVLGSVPQYISERDPGTGSPLSYNYRRGKVAWYSIDNIFYFPGVGQRSRPSNITDEDMENNYVRLVQFNEVFPNRQRGQIVTNELSFDLAYYPDERGHYNYNPDLTPEGKLPNPEQNFGAITRAITHDIDFDNINIQYIEFWLMDPFIEGPNGREVTGAQGNGGGKLFFNLGNISEDVIPDERHYFENGLPIEDLTDVTETPYGRVPNEQYLTNAFDVGPNARELQDVGFDGLSSEGESVFFDSVFLNRLPPNLTPQARESLLADPSADDFRYFLDETFDEVDAGVLDRYKFFNGMENNSPVNAATGQLFNPSSYTIPDNEDLNRDQTVSDIEQYYQYEVDLNPGMSVENNPYIVDELDGAVDPATGQRVKWYQFRIPLRSELAQNINGINGFKSIRFVRMFLTEWREPVVLRMVQFQFVGAQWRPFDESLIAPELAPLPDNDQTSFTVSSVNIEENGQDDDPETIAYNLPPGFTRDFDVTSNVTRQLNEQSIQLCVENLQDGDAQAAYKNYNLDLINYGRIRMEVHAQDPDTQDDELRAFIRLGTDFKQNYYEIEVPLKITPQGTPSSDRAALWPRENAIDIAIEALYRLKAERNRAGASPLQAYPDPIQQPGPNVGLYRVTVVGNPDLSSVQTVMLGIRNPTTPDRQPKDVCVWMNELRITDFDQTSGWATNLSLNTKLADFANISASLRYNTVGYGSIQDRAPDRSRSTNLDYDISANINLEKILLGKLGLTLPLFVSYEKSTSDPFFDPLDPDVPLDVALTAISDPFERSQYREKVRDISTRRSINMTNIRKQKMREDAKSHIWDIENLSFSAAYTDAFMRNATTEAMEMRQWRLGAVYGYTSQAKPFEPFKNVEMFESPWLQLIKDFNLNLVPTTIAVRGDLRRNFRRMQLRNADLTTEGILPQFEKAFTFNRSYNLNWSLSNNLGLDYQAQANAIIDEPDGLINTEAKRDSIRSNLERLGRMKAFTQTVGLNYKIPFDKIPVTQWLSADARYSATFDWVAGAVGIADTLGNTVRNNNNLTVNGKVDLNKIYRSIPVLERITSPVGRGKVESPLERRKAKLEEKLKKLGEKQDEKEEKITRKWERRLAKLQKRFEKQMARDSSLTDSLQSVIDSIQTAGPPLPAPVAAPDSAGQAKPSKLIRKQQELTQEIAEIDEQIAQDKIDGKQPKPKKVLKGIGQFLLSVKNLNASYTETNGTVLPGFMPTPYLLGFDRNWASPGLPFILGSQDPDIKRNAAQNGWLAQNGAQNNPFTQNNTEQLTIRANAEPVRDLKIQIEARRTERNNYSEVFRWVPDLNNFETQTPLRTGSFGISFFSMATAFTPDDENNNSSVFEEFVANREIIRNRLNGGVQNGEFNLNSQDVLIPAFRAAYAGEDPQETSLSAFPNIPLPNWNLTYSGLSRIEALREVFRSVSITHGYKSEYAIGSYSSSLFYNDFPELLTLDNGPGNIRGTVADTSGVIVPMLVLNQVSISEQFAPLIGVNLRTRSDLTIKVDYKKQRNLMLNLSNAEVTELRSNDVTVDIGFTKTGMKLPFKIRGLYKTLENDVTMKLAFTLRDTKTVQRKIDESPTVTAGNINIQFRPTLAYQLNQQTNLQAYFERSINDPRVSNSFKRTTTSFGIQLRYAFTQ